MNYPRCASVAITFLGVAIASLGSERPRVEVNPVEGCSFETGVEPSLSFPIYDSRDGPAKGWSHIAADPESFPLAALDARKYAVDGRSMEGDEDCPDQTVLRTVLVRKMSNWDHQHANGIEPVFFDRPIRVDELDSVTLLIKFNSADSRLPSPEELREHYGAFFTAEQIDGLDTGFACLGLTFMGDGYIDPDSESLYGQFFLTLDPSVDFDRWLSVTIPMSAFSYRFEKRQGARPAPQNKVQESELIGFRIDPETTSGMASRNYLGAAWDDSVPELYKEVSISLARIEAQLAN